VCPFYPGGINGISNRKTEKTMTIKTKYIALIAAVLLLPASVFAQSRESTATFVIEKVWDQGGDTDGLPVTAHLNCTGALSTQQTVVFTATTNAVLFVYDIALIPEGQQVNCDITEEVPENYKARYECGLDAPGNCYDSSDKELRCAFPDVFPRGLYRCRITNRPDPAVVTVTKSWIIEGASQGFDGGHWVVGQCDSRVEGGTGFGKCRPGPNCYYAESRQDEAVDGEYEFTVVKPNYPFTRCNFFEDADDSVVESENGCGSMKLRAGDEVECEIINTVFFEGIPTLNQYGMAILALLMLGVGFVGFRRFV